MRKTKRTAVVGIAALGLIGGGVALAAWTATGTGQGDATATSAKDLIVNVGSATGLYPTGSENVSFTVRNPNPYQVTLTNAHPTNFTVDAAHSACNVGASISAADVALTDVLAASTTGAAHTVVVEMDNDAIDACQGATFSFDLVVAGASS